MTWKEEKYGALREENGETSQIPHHKTDDKTDFERSCASVGTSDLSGGDRERANEKQFKASCKVKSGIFVNGVWWVHTTDGVSPSVESLENIFF